MFSGLPGLTKVIEHDIVTEPGIRVKPYQIPEAHRKALSEEVWSMSEIDIIKESQSKWSSPIVLIPKLNVTLWFYNDFRKLGKVSKFNAYQMP